MEVKLTKGVLEEYEEERVLGVITSKSSQGKSITDDEIAEELRADPGVVKEVVQGLIRKGKVQEVI